MTNSPFSDFNTYTLDFQVKGISTPPVKDGDTGNVLPSASAVVTVECTLKPTSNPAVLRLVGSDVLSVALSGRLVEPMTMPAGLHPGTSAALTINDKVGLFTLGPSFPGAIPEVDEALGSRIIGTWKST